MLDMIGLNLEEAKEEVQLSIGAFSPMQLRINMMVPLMEHPLGQLH